MTYLFEGDWDLVPELSHDDDGVPPRTGHYLIEAEGDALSFASRKGGGFFLGVIRQADPSDQRHRAVAIRFVAAKARAQCHIVQRRRPGEEEVALRHISDASFDSGAVASGDIASEVSAGLKPRDETKERGFPNP